MLLYVVLTTCMVLIGVYGMTLSKKHVMMMLMCLELMLLAVNMNFLMSSIFLDDFLGQLYALLILTLAAAEIAVGLAICIVYYSLRGGISMDYINLLKS